MKLLGTRVALYVRRSTDEHQMASIDVQIEEATRYVEKNGGTIEHRFVDDAISRAEFKKRPGLIALLNAANAKQFGAVVVRDESRLGGDTFRSGLLIQDLLESGVRLFYYYADEEITLDGAVDKFMIAARSFAAELEREKTSQRTHEHLENKARRGFVVGGRVYGYENVEIKDGDRRVRVEYKINEKEAAIVREIFERYAFGDGLRTLVKDLNMRGIAPPRAGKRGTGSWSPASIHEMLRRERYRGKLVWGKVEKTYRGGTKVRVARAENEWITTEAPDLRIVSDELWEAVKSRGERRARMTGTTREGTRPRYLLSGIARCASCGGPIQAGNGKFGTKNVRVYGCAYYRDRGTTVCSNSLRRPIADVDVAIVGWIRENVLREDIIIEALQEVRQRLAERTRTASTDTDELRDEARKLRAEIDRLGQAIIAATDAPMTLVKMMSEREKRLSEVEARIAVIRTAPTVFEMELEQLEQEARRRIEDFAGMIGRNPQEGRALLERLVTQPLRFEAVQTTEGKRFLVTGELALESILLSESTSSDAGLSASPTRLRQTGYAVRAQVLALVHAPVGFQGLYV